MLRRCSSRPFTIIASSKFSVSPSAAAHLSLLRSSSTASSSDSSRQVPLWIANAPVPSSQTFEISHPTTSELASIVHSCEAAELERALASSSQASGVWKAVPAAQRRDILLKAATLLEERKELLAETYRSETAVSGVVREVDLQFTRGHVLEAAAICTQVKGEIPPTLDGSLALIMREPYGLCFSVAPFNFGLTLAVRTIVYPLACGNSVLLKASPLIPRTHYLLGELFKDAGLPDGVLNIIQFNQSTVAASVEKIISDNRVRVVNFTGSEAVGKIIGQSCGRHIKPVVLELGGKAAAIVMESADLEHAAHAILFGSNLHSGQTCMSTERAIVIDSVYDDFCEVLARKIQEIAADEHLHELAVSGEVPARKVKDLVEEAMSKGAKLLSGPPPASPHPAKVQPAVLIDVEAGMRIYREESFGPVLSVIRAKDAAHAVEIANSSQYGLSGSVWSKDYLAAINLAKQLECSAIHINSGTVHDEPTFPHGGHKSSGIGRFNGTYAIQSFTQTKTITMRVGEAAPPFAILA